jgi:hypothetical protein
LERTLSELEAQLAADTQTLEETARTRRERIEARHDRRCARLEQASKSARTRRLQEVESWEGNRKYEIQRDLLQADREKDSGTKQAEDNLTAINEALAKEDENLAKLEASTLAAFRGYRWFRRLVTHPVGLTTISVGDEQTLLERLRSTLGEAKAQLNRFGFQPAPLLFRLLPPWTWLFWSPLIAWGVVMLLRQQGRATEWWPAGGIYAGAVIVLAIVLHLLGGLLSRRAARDLAGKLTLARQLHTASAETAATRAHQTIEQLAMWHTQRKDGLHEEWRQSVAEAEDRRRKWEEKLSTKTALVRSTLDQQRQSLLDQLERECASETARLRGESETRRRKAEAEFQSEDTKLRSEVELKLAPLKSDWAARIPLCFDTIAAARSTAEQESPDWSPAYAASWEPPTETVFAAKFGHLDVDLAKLAGALPQDAAFKLPGSPAFSVPLLIALPNSGSLLLETKDAGREEAIQTLNNVMLRLLASTPPGKVAFTLFDPVELGQSFAGIMHLADYEARLINDRIWTQSAQFEQKLADLNEHIEKVTQMYLRNEYETITEYNRQAGRIAEKYQFLVIADFPANFSEVAARRLLSIAASGPRCGVFTLIHWDLRRALPHDFVAEDLRANSLWLRHQGNRFAPAHPTFDGVQLALEAPPSADVVTTFLHRVGKSSVDSSRVEMPFSEIAPPEAEAWSLETTQELRVPIGRTGATKQQYLALGKGTRQHALIAGKTGSGKSTLFHVLITNLALWCRPEQVEFYLVDFKKGVEFKCYATHRLPHARVVAIESDREFGLSVLQRVDEELKRRGDLFRKLGVQDIPGYQKAGGGGTEPIPRTLLLIDEFQEFFVEDDRISQNASLLLDRIVRQGRAFGIHVVLGSQTLGGAYTLARTTLGQMAVRIALQCNEADAHLIMDEDNAAPRLLTRPGEAIYNDASGALEGNSPFQVVWLPDEERDKRLDQVRQLAARASASYPGPIVFEGNAPADITENPLLQSLLAEKSVQPSAAPRIWLGAPNSIKGPTEAVFRRQSGSHLLIVGQREESALAILVISLVCLAAQHPRGTARFILFDSTPPGPQRDFIERVVKSVPHDVKLAGHPDTDILLAELAEDMARRSDPATAVSAPAVFVLVHELPRFKKLRYDEEFEFSLQSGAEPNAGSQFNKLICEGASLGLHVIATCDTANNVSRSLSRKAISEFEMRVLFQMSAADSATLIDSPKAGNLGLHRALFFNGREGHLETFRPYALPSRTWLEESASGIRRLLES